MLHESQEFQRVVCTLMRIEVYFLITVPISLALKITHFEVPSLLIPGDSAYLTCFYDLGKEKLYSIKWYKDSVEFYRFFPSLSPQYMAFPSTGVNIDLTRSGPNTVFLRNVTLETEGRYTCQVSADEPYFGCVQLHRDISVYIPPEDSPQITGGVTEHGENLTIRCSSSKSKPAANLSLYVNDVLMMSDLTESQEVIRHPDQLESTSASLNIPLSSTYLPPGDIRLTCAASISNLVTSVSKELLISRQNNNDGNNNHNGDGKKDNEGNYNTYPLENSGHSVQRIPLRTPCLLLIIILSVFRKFPWYVINT